MLYTIMAIWAVVIPVATLAVSWGTPDRREASEVHNESTSTGKSRTAVAPRAARPSRATARRMCPQLAGAAHRRPASA